jgi:origin recognition complex subunit 4
MFELVRPVDNTPGKCPKEYRMTKLMLEQAQVTEVVLKYNCSQIVKKWATGAA